MDYSQLSLDAENLIRFLPGPSHVADENGRIVAVSPAWLAMLGYEKQDVLGCAEDRFFDFKSSDTTGGHIPRFSAPDGESSVICAAWSKGGEWISVSIKTKSVSLSNGGPTFAISILDEIIGFKQLTEQLRRKAFRLQSCLEGTDAATWEWNIQTSETVFNERWAEIVGYKLAELEPTDINTWLSLAHPDDLALSEMALKRHWAGDTAFYDVEARMRHKDGHWVWVRDRGRVMTWTKDGQPEWMFGTHFGIDEEKKREAELVLSAQLLEKSGQVAGVGGWRVDLETEHVLWTDETRRIHGVNDGYVPTVEDGIAFYAPEARPKIKAAVETAMTNGEPWDLNLPLQRQDGETIWVRAVGQAFYENGQAKYLYGAFQDITNQIKREETIKTAQEWLEITGHAGGIGLWSIDTHGQVTWNKKMAHLFRIEQNEAPKLVSDWLTMFPEMTVAGFDHLLAEDATPDGTLEFEVALRSPSGKPRRLKLRCVYSTDIGVQTHWAGACFDTTDEYQLARTLETEQKKLETILNSVADGVLVTNRFGVLEWMNAVAEDLIGISMHEAIGKKASSVLRVFDEISSELLTNPIYKAIQWKEVVNMTSDAALQMPDGSFKPIANAASPIFDEFGSVEGVVCVFRDVSRDRKLRREAEFRATHDTLTGLANRRAFHTAVDEILPNVPTDRRGFSSAVLFIDLDGFKQINDTEGHMIGDNVLIAVADALKRSTRETDLVARLGGDEFLILLEKVPHEKDIITSANRIQAELSKITASKSTVKCSIGATSIRAGDRFEDILNRADKAMYQAKKSSTEKLKIE